MNSRCGIRNVSNSPASWKSTNAIWMEEGEKEEVGRREERGGERREKKRRRGRGKGEGREGEKGRREEEGERRREKGEGRGRKVGERRRGREKGKRKGEAKNSQDILEGATCTRNDKLGNRNRSHHCNILH